MRTDAVFDECVPYILYAYRVGDIMYIGAHNFTDCRKCEDCEKVKVTAAWMHENYNWTTRVHDVAVVKYVQHLHSTQCIPTYLHTYIHTNIP